MNCCEIMFSFSQVDHVAWKCRRVADGAECRTDGEILPGKENVPATSIGIFLCQMEQENTLDAFAVAMLKTDDFCLLLKVSESGWIDPCSLMCC